jgi:uncharacterized protein (DUF1330 family)
VQVAEEIEMAAYWIGAHAITDPAKFEEYLRKVLPMIERFGGRTAGPPGRARAQVAARPSIMSGWPCCV